MRRRTDQRLFDAAGDEVGPGNTRPQWGRGPTMRRRIDQRLFVAAGDEVGPGNKQRLTPTLIPASITPSALRRRYP